jgi:hypothetical protein
VRSSEGADGATVDHPDRSLARRLSGGFEIDAAGQPTIRVTPSGDGWRIDGGEGLRGWTLRRTTSGAEGFVLIGADGRTEAGRTMPLVGAGREAGLKFLMLDDGRLFRIVLCGPRQGGFELLGWELPGAYLAAQPVENGWTIVPTPACGGLEGLSVRTISILFAAEILDAEEPLRPEAT